MENGDISTFKAIIAIDELGTSVLLKSNPSLHEHSHFDGFFLSDNLTNEKNVPKEAGVYKCDIKYQGYKYWTDCGYEYDCNCWIENISQILNLNNELNNG